MKKLVVLGLLLVSVTVFASDNCYICDNTGFVSCTSCNQTGCGMQCSTCDGVGVIIKSCMMCNGDGYRTGGFRCFSCNGTGIKQESCYACRGNGCGGKCYTCNGTGWKKCLSCKFK